MIGSENLRAHAAKEAYHVHRNPTLGRIDCRHLDFNDSAIVELHRCTLSDRDWNPWVSDSSVASTAWPIILQPLSAHSSASR